MSGGLGAIVLGIAAQLSLQRDWLIVAAVLYLSAAVLIVYALRGHTGLMASSDEKSASERGKGVGWWALAAGLAAGLMAVLALWQFDRDRPPFNPPKERGAGFQISNCT